MINPSGLNLSYDKHEHRPSRNTNNKTIADDLKYSLDLEQNSVRRSANGKKEKQNSNKCSSSDPVEKFEAEKGIKNYKVLLFK